jgi:hypothetical protein
MASPCLARPFLPSRRASWCHWPLHRLLVARGWMIKTCSLMAPYLKTEIPNSLVLVWSQDTFVSSIVSPLLVPPLSTTPTSTPISPPRARNHLPIGAPLAASIERRRVSISTAPPPSGAIGENHNDLLSLSLSLSLSYCWRCRPEATEIPISKHHPRRLTQANLRFN